MQNLIMQDGEAKMEAVETPLSAVNSVQKNLLDELEKAVANLNSKLLPVMVFDGELKATPEKTEEQVHSELYDSLDSSNTMLNRIIDKIEQITAKLEV